MGWYRIEGLIGCPVAVEAGTAWEALEEAQRRLGPRPSTTRCETREEACRLDDNGWVCVLRVDGVEFRRGKVVE